MTIIADGADANSPLDASRGWSTPLTSLLGTVLRTLFPAGSR